MQEAVRWKKEAKARRQDALSAPDLHRVRRRGFWAPGSATAKEGIYPVNWVGAYAGVHALY